MDWKMIIGMNIWFLLGGMVFNYDRIEKWFEPKLLKFAKKLEDFPN